MYEFIKTETGWRVFWGIDPCSAKTLDSCDDDNDASAEGYLLPFPQSEHDSSFCPVA